MRPRVEVAALAAVVTLGLAETVGFWGSYHLFGHSAALDYFRQLGFDRCVRGGAFYPGWLPDTYFGYGSPLFLFYAPAPYYVTEAFVLAGFSIVTAFKLTLTVGLIASGLSLYLWCRDFAEPVGSALAACAYMLAPFHLVDMVVRHALGEQLAFSLIPLAAWGVSGVASSCRPARAVIGALAAAALILSHNIMGLLGMGALVLWCALLAAGKRSAGALTRGLALLGTGVVLASFFWVPAVVERGSVWAQESLTQGYYEFDNHYLEPFQLVRPFWGFGWSSRGAERDGMSFQVGIPHLAVALVAALTFLSRRTRPSRLVRPLVVYGLLLLAGSLFMTLRASDPAYRMLPLLAYVQFPWRFLFFAALGSSLLFVAVEPLGRAIPLPHAASALATLVLLSLVGFYWDYTRPRALVVSTETHEAGPMSLRRAKGSRGVTTFERLGGLSYLRARGATGTMADDFLPRTVHPQLKPDREPAALARWLGPGEADVRPLRSGPLDLSVEVVAPQAGTLEVARFWFPGWTARANGAPLAAGPRVGVGTIAVPLSPGRTTVEVRFASTPLRRVSAWLSAGMLGVLIAWRSLSRGRGSSVTPSPGAPRGR